MHVNSDIFIKHWLFLKSIPTIDLLPPEGPPEIAFAGRSNVGKSSLINRLLNQKGLARTSNSPGRTQELNYFIPDGYSGEKFPPIAVVDMPGYGYAKAPKEQVNSWKRLILKYLCRRLTLKRVYLLIDARHGIKENDKDMLLLLDKVPVSYQIILTKIDKINAEKAQNILDETKKIIIQHPAAYPFVFTTSSKNREGIDALRNTIVETINL